MAHPVHDLLLRLLNLEQSAFDVTISQDWPTSRWPSMRDRIDTRDRDVADSGEFNGSRDGSEP
jgi:hypothetical protein